MTKLNELMMANAVRAIQNKEDSPMKFDLNEAQINAAEQAKELRVETCTEANVDETHESRLRHMVAIMDEADAETVLRVLAIKHPFVMMDVLKEYFKDMDKNLRELREIFTDREAKEDDICGGND